MKCPYCKSTSSWRMRTQRWMRFTPGSIKNMRCSDCGAEFTEWIGFIPLRHSTARRMTLFWHAFLWIALCLAVGYALPAIIAACSV